MLEQYIRSIEINAKHAKNTSEYPFNIPAIQKLQHLDFHPKVTFIVGENGSGKSTLLEALAVNYGLNPEGGSKNFSFSTKNTHSTLFNFLRIVKGVRLPTNSFFLRAESFYNLASNIDDLDKEPGGAPIKDSYGGKSLHEQSHGESFFSLFLHRFSKNGIYILDEPEAALSPQRQMAFLVRLHELVNQGAQFIIATHSPIIMAYKSATLYTISDAGYEEKSFEETDYYAIYKNFMNNPDKALNRLLA